MRHDERDCSLNFLRSRKLHLVVLLELGIGVLVVLMGANEVAAPVSALQETEVPFRRLFALVAGAIPVAVLASPMASLEAVATQRHLWFERSTLVFAALFGVVCVLADSVADTDWSLVAQLSRTYLAGFGVALIAGKVLGWRLAWVGPWVILAFVIFVGYDSSSQTYRWWDVTARPSGDVRSWLLSIAIVGFGFIAYTWSLWFWRSLFRSVTTRDD